MDCVLCHNYETAFDRMPRMILILFERTVLTFPLARFPEILEQGTQHTVTTKTRPTNLTLHYHSYYSARIFITCTVHEHY